MHYLRPKTNPDQRRRAYRLHRLGLGHKDILAQLKKEFHAPVSLRTVANWVAGFKKISEATSKLDAPFEWHRMEEYGLPWEASSYLLDMWATDQREMYIEIGGQTQPLTIGNREVLPTPTVRQVRWWWRVHLAAPELPAVEVQKLAAQFEECEITFEVLEEPNEMAGLEAFLAFKPWASDAHKLVYDQNVKGSRIPKLRGQRDEVSWEDLWLGW